MAKIEIIRGDDGKVEFQPSPLEVLAGDNVFWSNLDPEARHWITKKDDDGKIADKNFWFPDRLAVFVAGQPADKSSSINVRGKIRYVCSDHPGEEGEITVKTAGV
jgi:plastocyanin